MKKTVLVLAVALLMASLAGCMGENPAPAPTATPEAMTEPSVTAAPDQAGTPEDQNKPAAPAQLGAVKAAAEGIMNDADAGNWDAAQAKLDTIKKDASELTVQMQEAGVDASMTQELNTPIGLIEQQISDKDAYETKVQANQITKVMPAIYDYFQVKAPTDLGRMGYLAREIVLNTEKDDWANAEINAAELKNIWDRLMPQLTGAMQQASKGMDADVSSLNNNVTKKDKAAITKDSLSLQQAIISTEQA